MGSALKTLPGAATLGPRSLENVAPNPCQVDIIEWFLMISKSILLVDITQLLPAIPIATYVQNSNINYFHSKIAYKKNATHNHKTQTKTTLSSKMRSLNLVFRSTPSFTAAIIFLYISTAMHSTVSQPKPDMDLLEFPLNLEYFEAEYFLFGSLGKGLDSIDKSLAAGGPPPVGAKQAKLTPVIKDIITQFAYQEIGHLRAIKKTIKGFPRPLLNLTAQSFATVIDAAFGKPLSPPFDPYANDVNYLISSYVIPYVGLTGYVGANPKLQNPDSRKLVAGLLGVESGQDAVIRTLLYERANQIVAPYKISVSEFTNKISQLRDKLGKDGLKDEGLKVPIEQGAEKKTEGNILAGDPESLAYGRTPEEILRIVYGTGDERKPGGFYPKGGDGAIAKKYLPR